MATGNTRSGPSISRARLSTSMEPSGIAGTSWNSVRWNRPSSSGYRTSRLANSFEPGAGGSNSSAASSCSSSVRGQSPLAYTLPSTLRSSERASSAATRPQNDAGQIRPNSRFGTSFLLNSSSNSNGSSSTAAAGRTSQSASSALSPRQEPPLRKSYPYRTMGLSQPRAALVDMRQNLRPVKRQFVTDYKPHSSAMPSSSSSSSAIPLALFTNVENRIQSSALSPFPKCVSPPSATMSRSSSTVTSPITTPIAMNTRPIPKSERPWRQKLADAQRLREAQAERTFGNHVQLEPYDTAARILAARTARRASIEHQQTQKQQNNEQQLEKEIAALKCYVSEPGALDKNATVAKFRQRMAEGHVTPSLASPPSSSSSSTIAALATASSLLSRMPSMSRRSMTAVTKEAVQQAKSKDRPLSMVETPFGQRRLSVVQEAASIAEAARPEDVSSPTTKTPPSVGETDAVRGKAKESPKAQRKAATKGGRTGSRASTASTGSTTVPASPTGKTATKEGAKMEEKKSARKKDREEAEETVTKMTPTIEKKKSSEDEAKGFNAVFQFKPQSMVRRKISNEEGTSSRTMPKWRKPPMERSASHEESPKPVPGTWERTPKERFISQNKHLIRKASSASTVHTHKMRPLARVCSARMMAADRPLAKGEDGQLMKSVQTVKHKGSPTAAAVLKMIKSIAKPKQRICAVAVVDKHFAKNRSFRLGVRKTLLLKSFPQKLCAQLRCRSAQMVATTVRFNIVWKEQKKMANVTILLADWEHVASGRIREPSSRRRAERSPLKRIQHELDKENRAIAAANVQQQEQENTNNNNNGSRGGRPIIIGGKGGKELAPIGAAAAKQPQKQIPSPTRQQQFPTAGASLVAAAAGSITAAVAALSTRKQQPQQSATTNQRQQPQQKVPPSRPSAYQKTSPAASSVAPPPPPPHYRQPQQVEAVHEPQPLLKVPQLGQTPLILPDHSVLEQFIQSKRDALDRLHGDAEEILDQAREVEQIRPPLATAASLPGSKRNSQMLMTAMAPTEAQQLAQQSLMSSSFHAAIQTTAADLRAQQQQQQMAKLRRPQPELITRATLSTQAFEKPKSLFEEQMQRQAIQLQQKAVRQSLHEPIEQQQAESGGHGLSRRRSAGGEHADVAHTFVAQAQKPYQSEQRYAAHIPLSGRQSTTSIESANSSAPDAATHQLDQMIDQARFKHSQQRNKFKEAIDYLDHIFEDFQREADMRQPPAKKTATAPQAARKPAPSPATTKMVQPEQQQPQLEPIQATFRAGNVKSAKDAFEKVAAAIASEKKAGKIKKQTSAPAQYSTAPTQHQQKPSNAQQRRPDPFPVIVTGPAPENSGGEEEVEVAETIVLPSKNTADRLDFTRNWLASGDVRTWADGSPRRGDQLLGQKGTGPVEDDRYDSDEHSLGSCSAEVAAINAANERRQRQKQMAKNGGAAGKAAAAPAIGVKRNGGLTHHQSLKNGTAHGQTPLRQKQPPSIAISNATTAASVPPPQIVAPTLPPSTAQGGTLSRPQPYRPQPQLGMLPTGLGASGQMHKVPSNEHLRLRTSQERACSQDYQSMGSSVHSQEGFRPQATYLSTHSLQRLGVGGTGGAFHSYTPTTMMLVPQQAAVQPLHPHQQQLKGSIQSLPDSALCTAPNPAMMMPSAPAAAMPNYPPAFPYQPSRQFATLARMDQNQNAQKQQKPKLQPQQHQSLNHHQQQYPSSRGERGGAPAIPAHQSNNAAMNNEHALAIDALVAELELNTDTGAMTVAEKRRSFPTMQTEMARSKANQEAAEKVEEEETAANTSKCKNGGQKRQQNGCDGSMSDRSMPARNGTTGRPLEKITELMLAEKKNNAAGNDKMGRKQSGGGNRPFETINQERLNPSKVDAMARMFDQPGGRGGRVPPPMTFTTNGTTTTGTGVGEHTWTRRAATIGGRIPSSQRIANGMPQSRQNGGGDGDSSCQGGAATAMATTMSSSIQQNGGNNHQQLRPLPQQSPPPPLHHAAASIRVVRGTKPGTKSAAFSTVEKQRYNSSGRKEENSRPMMMITSAEGEDGEDNNNGNGCGAGGFYDNVHQRQRLRPSPGYYSQGGGGDDCSSLSSQSGSAVLSPPATGKSGAGGRIGQLIRKLGNVGGGGKPPMSAASMVSLNRVSNELNAAGRDGGGRRMMIGGDGPALTKSNSLSGEPWRCQVLAQQNGGGGGKHPAEEENGGDKHNGGGGIGNRLKQSIFGGMVRRRVPT